MYYPLSQVSTNLYTNGNEYIIAASKEPYSGFYWKTSKGEFFTGKTPQDTPTQRLIPLEEINPNEENEDNLIYTELAIGSIEVDTYTSISSPFIPAQIPTYSPNVPIPQDYEIGEYRRYFCKKTNEIIYIEINKDTYDKLSSQNDTIEFEYYQAFNIPWQLTGDKEQVFTVNRNIVALTMKQQKLPQFDLYLKRDYTKYYK